MAFLVVTILFKFVVGVLVNHRASLQQTKASVKERMDPYQTYLLDM